MRALTVEVSETAVPGSGERAPVRRVRTALACPVSGAPVVDEHLLVGLPAPRQWPLLADVLLATGDRDHGARVAARHPGALVIAVHRGPECWMRLGPEGVVLTLRARRQASRPQWRLWASLAHTWLAAGLPATALGSVPVRILRVHPAGPSRRLSRARNSTASADSARPTAA